MLMMKETTFKGMYEKLRGLTGDKGFRSALKEKLVPYDAHYLHFHGSCHGRRSCSLSKHIHLHSIIRFQFLQNHEWLLQGHLGSLQLMVADDQLVLVL